MSRISPNPHAGRDDFQLAAEKIGQQAKDIAFLAEDPRVAELAECVASLARGLGAIGTAINRIGGGGFRG